MFESYIDKKRSKLIKVIIRTATMKNWTIDYVLDNLDKDVKSKFNITKDDFVCKEKC